MGGGSLAISCGGWLRAWMRSELLSLTAFPETAWGSNCCASWPLCAPLYDPGTWLAVMPHNGELPGLVCRVQVRNMW